MNFFEREWVNINFVNIYITNRSLYNTMPRKGTKEKFKSINIELSSVQKIRKHKLPNEPLYQTVHRILSIYDENELSDAHFLINEYQETMKRQKEKIDKLELERRSIQTLERFV